MPLLSDTARTPRTLFEGTLNERTVYLGPWEVVGSEQRRIIWQCSYQSELLEHFRTLLPGPVAVGRASIPRLTEL